MFGLMTQLGWDVFGNVAQMAIGSSIAVMLYNVLIRKQHECKLNNVQSLFGIMASSFIGMLLPLSTWGVIPIVLVLFAVGISHVYILPFMFANTMFNILVVFLDPTFSLKTGAERIILAFAAAILSGVVFKILDSKNDAIIRPKPISVNGYNENIFFEMIQFFGMTIDKMGIYLMLGAIINIFFHNYLAQRLIDTIFINSPFSQSLSFLLRFDIANPFFLTTYNLFVNFTTMALLCWFLKFRTLLIYIASYSVLAVIFSVLMI